MSDVPAPALTIEDGVVRVSTDDELKVLHELTGWAISHDYILRGLAVTRISLEDVYLSLTRNEQ